MKKKHRKPVLPDVPDSIQTKCGECGMEQEVETDGENVVPWSCEFCGAFHLMMIPALPTNHQVKGGAASCTPVSGL